jgi:hypothetical protein
MEHGPPSPQLWLRTYPQTRRARERCAAPHLLRNQQSPWHTRHAGKPLAPVRALAHNWPGGDREDRGASFSNVLWQSEGAPGALEQILAVGENDQARFGADHSRMRVLRVTNTGTLSKNRA